MINKNTRGGGPEAGGVPQITLEKGAMGTSRVKPPPPPISAAWRATDPRPDQATTKAPPTVSRQNSGTPDAVSRAQPIRPRGARQARGVVSVEREKAGTMREDYNSHGSARTGEPRWEIGSLACPEVGVSTVKVGTKVRECRILAPFLPTDVVKHSCECDDNSAVYINMPPPPASTCFI